MPDVKLDTFEGPLDLLLKLIQRNEIDIYDIPMARLTADYMEVISLFPPEMNEISEFLVMAATLLEIKSKMLLPRPKIDDVIVEDPREELARQLLAYQEAQTLAERLNSLTPAGEPLKGQGDKELLLCMKEELKPDLNMPSILLLAEIFNDVMRRNEEKTDQVRAGYGEVPRERFTITEKAEYILNTLKAKGRLQLASLFLRCRSRREMVVTFLALLELMRRGNISAKQPKTFGDVEVMPCPA